MLNGLRGVEKTTVLNILGSVASCAAVNISALYWTYETKTQGDIYFPLLTYWDYRRNTILMLLMKT